MTTLEEFKAQLASAEQEKLRLLGQIATMMDERDAVEAQQSAIYQRVSRMTTLEGEARENGGIMAMLDEISERAVHDYQRAEAAEARVKELESDTTAEFYQEGMERAEARIIELGQKYDEWARVYAAQSQRLRAVTDAADAMQRAAARAIASQSNDDAQSEWEAASSSYDAAKSGDLPKPDRKHVCAFSRAINGECFVCGSVDEKMAQAQAEADARHAKSGDLPPHEDTARLDWLIKMLRDGTARLRMAIIATGHISGDSNEQPILDRKSIDAARAQAGKEAQP